MFTGVHLAQAADSEPSDKDIIKGRFEEEEDREFEYFLTKHYSYSREYKLIIIKYF